MFTIITQPTREAHSGLGASTRKRADRLAKATTDQLQAALAYLSMIDPETLDRPHRSRPRRRHRRRRAHPRSASSPPRAPPWPGRGPTTRGAMSPRRAGA